ncbi:DNA polymerase III subunit chi [Paenirhodobacter enshiensis]|uniref:DNA polymerase III subunit chi n=1 Tax=Paenirhodobacter enshiensis TaxID=1105367 RepID=UPI0035B08148
MMPALFYHVTQSSVDAVVSTLLERALQQGWRIELRTPSRERSDWYDQRLWLGSEEGFLPHGLQGGPHDALQPVLLTERAAGPGFQAVMSVEGAEVAPDEVPAHERVWILFDGRDPMAVERARDQWRALAASGAGAQYWSEETGRWQKKAEA